MLLKLTKTIEVRAEHIAKGMARDAYRCPIRLALEEHSWIPGCTASYVACRYNGQIYVTPIAAKNWMIGYDRGQKMEPFSFEFDFEKVR